MISDSKYIIYSSILKIDDLLNDFFNETIRIMIFLSEFELKIFELKKSNINYINSNSNRNSEDLCFLLYEKFKIDEIISIITKKTMENIITIEYKKFNQKHKSIILDLINDKDAKNFIEKTKYYINKNISIKKI
jgi:hypothetical protein